MKITYDELCSRRALLRASLGAVAGAGMAAAAVAAEPQRFAQAAQKLAQKDVQYQTTPKDGHRCNICVNFQAPSSCALVAGTISPVGWCVAFAPKAT